MKFEVGDKVSWTSQSWGHRTTKMGRVVWVIAPGRTPETIGIKGKFGVYPRSKTSYLVQVGNKLYWPKISTLRSA